jgi:CHASE2 domain-containing sensor protein/two-component sensor histidine kinase
MIFSRDRLAQPFSRRFLVEWLIVAVVSLAAVAVLDVTRATAPLDGLIYDRLLHFSERATPDDILIVAIDERSLSALGRWPWPRSLHAALLQRLAKAAPAAVVYDVLFVEPQPAPDTALAQAVAACGRVYLPLLISVPGANGAPYDVARPVAPIAAAAAGLGQVNLHPDSDGVVRRAFLMETDGVQVWPHLIGTVYEALHGPLARLDRARVASGPAGALEGRAEMLIPYAGPAGRMRTVSFVDVLRGEVPDAFLRGKTILVGATAAGLADRFPTPVGDMSGVELQANMLDGLAKGLVARPAGAWGRLLFSLAPVAILLCAFLTLRPRLNAALGAGLILATLAVSAAALSVLHLWLAPGAALAGLALAYPIWGWRRLEASSAYMLEELARLQQEPGVLEDADAAPGGGDVVERQLRLMRRQVGRMRDLRRFVSDALQGLPDATFVVSTQGRIMMTSTAGDAFLSALKLDPNERSIGAVFQRLSGADEDNAPPLSLGEPATEVVEPNGARYQLGQSPILSHDGEALGWIVRLGDVSEIRAAQERREEILQLLTHDMRSPQASILALLAQTDANATAAPVAGRIRALAQRTLALADAYVRLSRAESAQLKLEALDAADVLVEAVDAVWPQAQAKGVTLTATPDDEALIEADRSLVTRALINLIDNAVRHAPSGSAVVCWIEPAEGEIAFVVQDHGPGLEPERMASLFKRFGAVGSAAVKSGGVGLGLALVRATALRHGGRIDCQSRPGEGAAFRLILPRTAPVSD